MALLAALAVGAPDGSIARAVVQDPPCLRHAPGSGWSFEDHAGFQSASNPLAPGSETGADGHEADRLADADLVRELVEWIGAHSDYDVSAVLADPPEVAFCEPGDRLSYEDTELVVEPHIRGIYDNRRATIRLVRPWNATDPRSVSTLLHELIHHVQWREGEWSCAQETEWEAYKLQEAFLNQHGLASGFDWMAIFMFSRCPDGVHP